MKIVTFDMDDTLVRTSENAFLKTRAAGIRLGFGELSRVAFFSRYGKFAYEECVSFFFP